MTPDVSTRCLFPSHDSYCLALGADSPYADERCVGNLGFSACGTFTRIIATHVSIRTSDTSSRVYTTTFAVLQNALLPYDLSHIRSFGYMLEPRYIFRAGRLDQ